ncbi:MAG: hypothetical protein ACO1Q7_16640, partial [Gemmatimonas sp.]
MGTVVNNESAGSTNVDFGGSIDGSGLTESRSLFWSNNVSWVAKEGQHSLKLGVEAIASSQRSVSVANQFGAFEFLNLTDLANNIPTEFRRNFAGHPRTAQDLNIGVAIGDSWRVRPGKFEVQGGLRLDASVFTRMPEYNQAVDSLLGLRTDQLPNSYDISPRFGFSWRPIGTGRTPLVPGGTTTLESNAAGAFRSPLDAGGIPIQPDAEFITVSGGFGLFRGSMNLVQLAAVMNGSGSEQSRRQLSCSGLRTPRPDWRTPMVLDEADCDEGSSMMIYDRSDVQMFSPDFGPPVSYRGNLAVDGISLGNLKLAPQAVFT